MVLADGTLWSPPVPEDKADPHSVPTASTASPTRTLCRTDSETSSEESSHTRSSEECPQRPRSPTEENAQCRWEDLLRPCEEHANQDPIERFFVLAKWQRQLTGIQESLRDGKLNGTLRELNGTVRESVVSTLKKGRSSLGNTLRDRQLQVRHQTEAQVKALSAKLEQVLAKTRTRKVRQIRHMVCFSCSMANMFVMAFWVGRFPETFHYYYTANCVWLIGCRAIWYKWHKLHYFLLDLCYWVNAALLVYVWVLRDSEWLFNGLFGCTGILMSSVFLFRNSFVPHSLERVTNFKVHALPMIQLWVLRWPSITHAGSWPWSLPEAPSVVPSILMYLLWALLYSSIQFVFLRRRIEREGYDTLYKLMTVDMGFEEALDRRLPKGFTGPIGTRVFFMSGHFCLFMAGLPTLHFSYWVHTVSVCVTLLWAFKNGAAFYMTYFWRVYDEQISAFERQMAEAEKEMQDQMQSPIEKENQNENPNDMKENVAQDTDELGKEGCRCRPSAAPLNA